MRERTPATPGESTGPATPGTTITSDRTSESTSNGGTPSPRRRRTRRAAATALLALAGALATAGPAGAVTPPWTAAVTAPAFLSAGELPPHWGSEWRALPPAAGLPETQPFCVAGLLPRTGVWHREFTTEFETNARQITLRAESAAAARKLTATLERAFENCADRVTTEDPGASATGEDYGPIDVEDGAHVYGVGIARPESSTDRHLFGVGRDGRTVTVVSWGEMGKLDGAPVADFRDTTRTAVDKLHR
ncbi:hypothetical protein [Streptomyces zingiberis]|uniref:Sensor domain-containing protein n=1 Tax=Streptomyces zingiberis TaxID=2053010 RepID=A0ABX1C266_9ACTN|nr:hypothetical protein [Streptomyces zingiberis]NJQ03936.1 hypothetical protein [Streptomyces zingiberis]